MIGVLLRKARQVANDPTLRQWLIGRLLGRWPAPPAYTIHCPPYVKDKLPLRREKPTREIPSLETMPLLTDEVSLALPGCNVSIAPGDERQLFQRQFRDLEVFLAVHRFAWLAMADSSINPAWVNVLWNAWMDTHGNPSGDWPWHPYTAAERAINILDFARRHGLPGENSQTLEVLTAHATAIAKRLEYFGDHYSGNHLSNNGRGLYRLGLELGLPQATELGAEIILHEAKRLFLESGVLREGSSHYHLLVTRNYLDAALAARRHNRRERAELDKIAAAAVAVAASLRLRGGFPLVGDISPDLTPGHLTCLAGEETNTGWLSCLSDEDHSHILGLMGEAADPRKLTRDGWVRHDVGAWSALWHASPDGWSLMPGHGHQDLGSFELHYGDERVLIDPGRGCYGESGESALFRSAKVHNGLTIDGLDPYPPNKPYYDSIFRNHVGSRPPQLELGPPVVITHDGYGRLRGVGSVSRRFEPSGNGWTIISHVEGVGRRTVAQNFVTSHPVEVRGNDALFGGKKSYRLQSETAWRTLPVTLWHAYGEGVPGTMLRTDTQTALPFTSTVVLELV